MHKNYLPIAIEAAVKAGEVIMKIYNSDMEVDFKEDNSPLTAADQSANTLINSFLNTTPYPIISEENKNASYEERKKWTRCWIVDPLDGTKEFIKRNGEFTVNIALVSKGKPLLGVIYVPVTRELYFTGTSMKKAYKVVVGKDFFITQNLLEEAVAIGPSSYVNPPKLIVGSRSHLNQDTQDYVDVLKKEGDVHIVSKGSSLKFCLVAEGKAHQYPRFAPTMEWDTAAGQAICEAVGLKVIDRTTGRSLKYNKENLLNPHFLVTS